MLFSNFYPRFFWIFYDLTITELEKILYTYVVKTASSVGENDAYLILFFIAYLVNKLDQCLFKYFSLTGVS